MKQISLRSILIAIAVLLSSCGTPTPLPTPSDVSTLPDPTTLMYDMNDPNMVGIVMEPGQTRAIHTDEDEYFVVFFAGEAKDMYTGYIAKWDGTMWSSWTKVEVTADGNITYQTLSINAETRPLECATGLCPVAWYIIDFGGEASSMQ